MLFYKLDGEENLVSVSSNGLTKKILKNLKKFGEDKADGAILINNSGDVCFKLHTDYYMKPTASVYKEYGLFKITEALFCLKDDPLYVERKNGVQKIVYNGQTLESSTLSYVQFDTERSKFWQMAQSVKEETAKIKETNFIKENNLDEETYTIHKWANGPLSGYNSISIVRKLYPEIEKILPNQSKLETPTENSIRNLITIFDVVPQAKEKFLQAKIGEPVWQKIIENFSEVEATFKKDYALYGRDLGRASSELLENLKKQVKFDNKKAPLDFETLKGLSGVDILNKVKM